MLKTNPYSHCSTFKCCLDHHLSLNFRLFIYLNHSKVIKSRVIFFCELGKFTCDDNSCVPITARCDGVIDCPNDRADEKDCRM